MQERSRRIALCGMLAALSVVILLLGGIVPLATFCCPILAMVVLLPIHLEYGTRTGLTVYAAVSVLSMLLVPDPEVSLFFVFLGFYPIAQPRLNRIRHAAPRVLSKLLICNAAIAGMYGCLLFLFRAPGAWEEFSRYSMPLLLMFLVTANLTFFLLDIALRRFSNIYRLRIRGLLFRR